MNAKMVNFGGWDMPVEYSGIIAEHMACGSARGHVLGDDSRVFHRHVPSAEVHHFRVHAPVHGIQRGLAKLCGRRGGHANFLQFPTKWEPYTRVLNVSRKRAAREDDLSSENSGPNRV